jgi:hypothetical protein
MSGGLTHFRTVLQYADVIRRGMPSAEVQTMLHRLDAKSMAVLAELNAFLHLVVRVMSPL